MIYNVSLPKKKLQNYEKKNKDKYDLDRCGFHIFFKNISSMCDMGFY